MTKDNTSHSLLFLSSDEDEDIPPPSDLFGSSSDSESDIFDLLIKSSIQYNTKVKGLSIVNNFLSLQQQHTLVQEITAAGWFIDKKNQMFAFGYDNLPPFIKALGVKVSQVAGFFTSKLRNRRPLFDQMIVHEYGPGETICPHIDQLQYCDGIATISLLSSCDMVFSKESNNKKECEVVKLKPGTLVGLQSCARYEWKHSINNVKHRRISITLRKFLPFDQRPKRKVTEFSTIQLKN